MARTKTKAPNKLHRALHLQHHRHTGKLLHHTHTSFRSLAIVLVLAGACMIGLNILNRATAAELSVYASNPAPIPTDPAVITSPEDGTVLTKSATVVSGTCPVITPRVIVAILNNGQQTASVACDSDNKFSVTIVVEPGQHTLVARTYTITGDTGPDSAPVTFIYTTPPAIKSSDAAAVEAEEKGGEPLAITIDTPFITFGPAKDAIWSGTITGGTLPYKVHIDWDDGSSSNYAISKSGPQQFVHHYTSMQPHLITLRVTDADGRGLVRSYAAVTPYVAPAIGDIVPTSPKLPFRGSLPLAIYGLYLLILALFGFLWIRLHAVFAFAHVPSKSGAHAQPQYLFIAAKKRRRKAKEHTK